MTPVGSIRSIHRYLVKSMAGDPLERAELGWHGIVGDRRFAFRRTSEAGGFPWLTASRLATLVRYRPVAAADVAKLEAADVQVTTPSGQSFALASHELRDHLAGAFGAPVDLVHIDNGIFDDAPLSLISRQSIEAIGTAVGAGIDARRFRPNLVIDAADGQPYAEDAWVGRLLVLGSEPDAPVVSITQRDLRCVMINLDPDSAASDPRVLKAVGALRGAQAGVYATVVRAGSVRAGAAIHLEGG